MIPDFEEMDLIIEAARKFEIATYDVMIRNIHIADWQFEKTLERVLGEER